MRKITAASPPGSLNSPVRLSISLPRSSVSQLVTDFGRTHELSKSSHFHAQARAGKCGHHARRRAAARQHVLFRRHEGAVRPSSRRGNRKGAPAGCGSSQRAGQKQPQVRPGREFCERGPGQSAASAGAGAERFASPRTRNFPTRSGYSDQRTFPAGRRAHAGRSASRCCAAHRRSVAEPAGDHQSGAGREVRAKLCHGGARSLVSHDFGGWSDRPRPLSPGHLAQPLRCGRIQRQCSHF